MGVVAKLQSTPRPRPTSRDRALPLTLRSTHVARHIANILANVGITFESTRDMMKSGSVVPSVTVSIHARRATPCEHRDRRRVDGVSIHARRATRDYDVHALKVAVRTVSIHARRATRDLPKSRNQHELFMFQSTRVARRNRWRVILSSMWSFNPRASRDARPSGVGFSGPLYLFQSTRVAQRATRSRQRAAARRSTFQSTRVARRATRS